MQVHTMSSHGHNQTCRGQKITTIHTFFLAVAPGTALISEDCSDFHYERGYCLVNVFFDATRQDKERLSVYAYAFSSV